MREILYNVEPATAPESREASRVEVWIEQVAAVRRGLHQRFECFFDAGIEGNIFSHAIGPQAGLKKSWHQERLAVKLMRELLPIDHEPSMCPRRVAEARIHAQGRSSGFVAALIGQFEQRSFCREVLSGSRRGARNCFWGGLPIGGNFLGRA